MESSIKSTPGLIQQIIFNLPETDSLKIDKENSQLIFYPDDKTQLNIDFTKFVVLNNSLKISIDGKRCLPQNGEINFTGNFEISKISLEDKSFAHFISSKSNDIGSRIFLTFDLLRSIIYNLPPLPKVRIDIQKETFLFAPDENTKITIDIKNITALEDLIKIPIDVRGRLPFLKLPIHLACNIILKRINVKENNILYFNLALDKIIARTILSFIRGSLPKELIYLGGGNYKVDLTQLIPKPYSAEITEINVNNGIEVFVH